MLKEGKLAPILAKACNLDPKVSSDAKQAVNWRQGGSRNAGNFAPVMEQVRLRASKPCPSFLHRLCPYQADLKIVFACSFCSGNRVGNKKDQRESGS